MSHGFQVFRVDLLKGMAHKPLETWQVDSGHYAQYVANLAEQLASDQLLLPAKVTWGVVQNMSLVEGVEKTEPAQKYVRWLSAERKIRRISLGLRYGTVGSHTHAMGLDGDTELADRAPSRFYRAELVLPEAEGSGLLAVESISRSCPAPPVVLWLAAASVVAEKGKDWWRLKTEQVTDADYLSDLIDKSKNAEVKLRRVESGGADSAGDRRRTRYQLVAPLVEKQKAGAMAWIKSRIGGSGTLAGMLDVLGVTNTGDFDFNDGYIALDDGEASTRIGLSDVRETFTYPISEDRPGDDAWWQAVRDRFYALDEGLSWS